MFRNISILLCFMSSLNSQEKIIVGSENQIKVSAVREVIADYSCFNKADIIGISVESGVTGQPLSFEETVRGAKTRAEKVYQAGSLSIGLESGLMQIPTTNGEYMDVCVCSVYDGKDHHIGKSCGFRLPKEVTTLILKEGLSLNQAMKQCGFTDNPQLGASQGSVGVFTNNRISRKEYCKQSLITALISIEQNHYFR